MLASDGIWDVMSNEDVVRLCLRKIEMGITPETICEELMTECLSPDLLMTGTDNMTVVLVCFLHNRSYEDFSKRAKELNDREQKKVDEMRRKYHEEFPLPNLHSKNGTPADSKRARSISDLDEDESGAADGKPDVVLVLPQLASDTSNDELSGEKPSAVQKVINPEGDETLIPSTNDTDLADEGIVQERKKYKEEEH